MHVFIDFWKLKTENSLLHVFSFLHKLNFKNSFCFLSILSCQTSFLVLKIKNCFWKQKIRGKNSYQTYPKFFKIFIIMSLETVFRVIENVFHTKHTKLSFSLNFLPSSLKSTQLNIPLGFRWEGERENSLIKFIFIKCRHVRFGRGLCFSKYLL